MPARPMRAGAAVVGRTYTKTRSQFTYMNTVQNSADTKKMASSIAGAGIALMLIHIAYVCYGAIPRPDGLLGDLAARLYRVGKNLFFISDDVKAKCFMLLLMIPSLLLVRPSDRRLKYTWPLVSTLAGLVLFFSTFYLIPVNSDEEAAISYGVITFVGYLIIDTGASRIARGMRYVFDRKKFASDTSGFKQEGRRIE